MTDLFADFFAENFQGPAFEPQGTIHLAALGALLLLNLILLLARGASDGGKRSLRSLLALILIASEVAWHYWNYIYGKWTLQTMLPLDLRSFLVWVTVWMLLTKKHRGYELVYFAGIMVGIYGLALPDLGGFNFPHFVFFHHFVSYGLILTSALYMTLVLGVRPTWASMLRVFLWMNVFAGIVYYINTVMGTNYLGVNARLDSPALLWDRLPEWPTYLLYLELLGIAAMLVLYLPFALKDLVTWYFLNRDNASRLESISK